MRQSHEFRPQDVVLIATVDQVTGQPSGVTLRGVVTALMQHDRLRVRLSEELTVLVAAADCRLETNRP